MVALRDAGTGAIEVRAGIFDQAGEIQSFEHFHVGVVSDVVVPGADWLLPAQAVELGGLHNYLVTLPPNAVKKLELRFEFGSPRREWVLPVPVEIEPR